MRALILSGAATAALLVSARAGAAPPVFTDARVRLSFGRYAPADREFEWIGWIGAGAGLLRFRDTVVSFDADVETFLGNESRAFEANQSGYRLEGGVHRRLGPVAATAFFHHVSRHLIDRGKEQAVDWTFVGLRGRRGFTVAGRPVEAGLGLAHTTQDSLVGYRWELAAEAATLSVGSSEPYGLARTRLVTAEPRGGLSRSRLFDLTLETGARFRRGRHVLETFVAYEHRSDVRLLVAGGHDRAFVGFRLGFDGGDAVSRGPDGPSSAPWCSRR